MGLLGDQEGMERLVPLGRFLTIYILCLGLYISLETKKGMGQACMGGEIINYLHPVLRPIHLD